MIASDHPIGERRKFFRFYTKVYTFLDYFGILKIKGLPIILSMIQKEEFR